MAFHLCSHGGCHCSGGFLLTSTEISLHENVNFALNMCWIGLLVWTKSQSVECINESLKKEKKHIQRKVITKKS